MKKTFKTIRQQLKDLEKRSNPVTTKDLHPKFMGMTKTDLEKIVNDIRKYSPKQRAEAEAEINMRTKLREENIDEEVGTTTASVSGAGSDNSLHLKKARLFKQIYRRHKTKKEDTTKGVPS